MDDVPRDGRIAPTLSALAIGLGVAVASAAFAGHVLVAHECIAALGARTVYLATPLTFTFGVLAVCMVPRAVRRQWGARTTFVMCCATFTIVLIVLTAVRAVGSDRTRSRIEALAGAPATCIARGQRF